MSIRNWKSAVVVMVILACASTGAWAKRAGADEASRGTPDGLTPAQETYCDKYSGAAFGLCNAYCEAMDCDSAFPHASTKACNRVAANFERKTGEALSCQAAVQCPCEFDSIAADVGRCSVVSSRPGEDFLIASTLPTSESEPVLLAGAGATTQSPTGYGCFVNSTEPHPLDEATAAQCRSELQQLCP